MRTRRASLWQLTLLTSFLALIVVIPVVPGQAASDPALVVAAKSDDLSAVRALLAKHVNVNEPARDGSTALLWSAYNSDVEMTRALVAAGAAVNTPNHYGITPLLQASRAGDATLIGMLIKAGADIAAAHP